MSLSATQYRISFFVMVSVIVFSLVAYIPRVRAQNTVSVDAPTLVPRVNLFISPRAGTFTEGTSFDVPVYINTKGKSINAIDVTVNFDKNKLSVVRPSGGQSIIGYWIEPPSYDNTRGTVKYAGIIPKEGINTESGLIGKITFQAKNTGLASVSFNTNSKVLLNDGLGSEAIVEFDRGSYTVSPKAPLGVTVFSDTHPFPSSWYNNNSPVISWEKGEGQILGFSYVLDNIPNTIPDNTIDTQETTTSFEHLADGLWYFHIKTNKAGVWGSTGHFLIRIDTTPPAVFKPDVNYLFETLTDVDRTLISFFTTDNLSGIDHYEVGVLDKKQATTVSPVFIETESPFQVPLMEGGRLRVIVRAVDTAGNITDASIDIAPPSLVMRFIQNNILSILWIVVIAGLLGFMTHYLVGHHILRHIRRFLSFMKHEEMVEEEAIKEVVKQEDIEHKTEFLNDPPQGRVT